MTRSWGNDSSHLRQWNPAGPPRLDRGGGADLLARTHFSDGTEITLADGEHWITAFAMAGEGDPTEFFLSGKLGETWLISDRVGRSEALRQFRRFLEAA
jgi:hypothetical protein